MELFTPDFGLVFWMFVAFAVLFLLLWKLAWPGILKTVDSRADLIDKGVEYAQRAKEQLDNARAEAKGIIDEARRQQSDMIRESERLKSQLVEQARSEAKDAAQRELDAAKVQIAQQQKEAEHKFRSLVSELALDIASKVVEDKMKDNSAQSELVNQLLDKIESKN